MSDFNSFISSLSEEQKAALLDILTSNKNSSETMPKKENKTRKKTTKDQSTEQSDSTESVDVDSDFTMKRTESSNNRRREPVKGKKNQWVDEGEFRDYDTQYGERTPRNRPAPKKVDVECSVCGRSFKVDPRYVYGEYHRCSRCAGK
jgi:hypothetical protein